MLAANHIPSTPTPPMPVPTFPGQALAKANPEDMLAFIRSWARSSGLSPQRARDAH